MLRIATTFYARLAQKLLPPTAWAEDGDAQVAVFAEILHEAQRRRGWIGVIQASWAETWSLVGVARQERTRVVRQNIPTYTTSRRSEIMHELLRDVRYAIRAMGRAPVYALVVVLTLGLGIGANTAIFSVVNSVLLRPLPYDRPDELVRGTPVFRLLDSHSFGFHGGSTIYCANETKRSRNSAFTVTPGRGICRVAKTQYRSAAHR